MDPFTLTGLTAPGSSSARVEVLAWPRAPRGGAARQGDQCCHGYSERRAALHRARSFCIVVISSFCAITIASARAFTWRILRGCVHLAGHRDRTFMVGDHHLQPQAIELRSRSCREGPHRRRRSSSLPWSSWPCRGHCDPSPPGRSSRHFPGIAVGAPNRSASRSSAESQVPVHPDLACQVADLRRRTSVRGQGGSAISTACSWCGIIDCAKTTRRRRRKRLPRSRWRSVLIRATTCREAGDQGGRQAPA